MGSAALYQSAKRGLRVMGLDRFHPPHDRGSSHGDTRITRLAIGEGAHYTPLVQRSHEIWRQLEAETGESLLTQCGELIISSAAPRAQTHIEGFFQNTLDAARKYNIAHEELDAAQIRARFPQFHIADDEFGYFEPDAGFVRPEACIAAQLSQARKFGAEIRDGETLISFEVDASGVTVFTDIGRYRADKVILAMGAWMPTLLGGRFETLLKTYRQVLCWFEAGSGASSFVPERFPVFIWELSGREQGIYGFPDIGGGVKIATEQYRATVDLKSYDRLVSADEIACVHRDYIAPNFRDVSARCRKAMSCLYTVTPDAGFILDTLPDAERVILASCCSGHGFKHSAAIGEILADIVEGNPPTIDLSAMRLARFR